MMNHNYYFPPAHTQSLPVGLYYTITITGIDFARADQERWPEPMSADEIETEN